jgi:hypothetical protein
LLQHDFRDPDSVRGARMLPRQIVPTGAGVPVEQRSRNG